jgi:PAS domain S-box-containing protein
MRKVWWSVVGAVILVAAGIGLQLGRRSAATRVYRIGWGDSPPFQVRGGDGEPTGLAVDLIRTAAQRRGIRLQWMHWTDTSESALRGGKVDLWPLITITPERLQHFHITEPYLEAEYCLLVRADSPHSKVQDLATATIGFANPIDDWHLRQYLPNVRKLPRNKMAQVMDDLCLQRVDAAFVDAFTGISALLDRNRACGDQPLRWIAAPEIRSHFGIGARFETRGVADALRDEIGAIASEGKLAPILGQWGYMSAQQLESIEALLNAKRHERSLTAAAAVFALLFGLVSWQSVRVLRERNRTRLTERSLRETEQKLRLMANNMKEMVLAFDMDKRLIFANPAVEALTGYRTDELERDGFVNWIHPGDQARMLAHWAEIFQGGAFEDEEYRLITRDGRTRWASASWGPILDEAGKQIGVQGSERDITERKAADERLRESERRFRGLLEHVQLAAAIFDVDGNLEFVNDYTTAITGWTREELIGHHTTEFLAPEEHGRVHKLLVSLKQRGEPLHWLSEIAVLTKDGKRRCLLMNHVVLVDSAGKVTAVASLGADITEHRELQEQYLQSQKLESLGTMAGGVAHDFNNLLTVINGYCDLILSGLRKSDAVWPQIEEIRKAGSRAAELTQQLLAFSRRQITQPRPVDLNGILEESGAMFRTLLGEDIALVTNLDRQLGTVMADKGQMLQIFMNLLVNARDAMPHGGRLTIETRNTTVCDAPVAENPEARPGPYVSLAVSDSGVGMDEQTRLHIFEPFFTTKGPGKGTGLGLSTVYGIVKQANGWISVHSEVGKGTAFEVYLPRIGAKKPATEELPSAAPERGQAGTILVVEDEDGVRGLATLVLESLGYRVLSAAEGNQALALGAEYAGPIDLVLMDVVLPGMSGTQLAERFKVLHPEAKVLFASGYSMDLLGHRGVIGSDIAYIAKPYTPEDLGVKVREVLAG